MHLSDKQKLAISFLFALIVLVVLAVELYDSSMDLLGPQNIEVSPAAKQGIKESIQSGLSKEIHAFVQSGENFYVRDALAEYAKSETYYINEFYTPPQVSLELDCSGYLNCNLENSGKGVNFEKGDRIIVRTTCTTKQGKAYECKIEFSQDKTGKIEDSQDSTQKLTPAVAFSQNPLFDQLEVPLNGDLQSFLKTRETLLSKNPIEKTYLALVDADYKLDYFQQPQRDLETSYLGTSPVYPRQPYKYVAQGIILLARLGIAITWASPENQYFYPAQKKYGLRFPDGSENAQEFIAKMKGIALKRKEETQNRLLEEEKEFKNKPVLDAFALSLKDIGDGVSKESLIIYDIKDSDTTEIQVEKALIIFEIEKDRGNVKFGITPIVSAENQIKWLNATNGTNAAERMTIARGTTVDFNALAKKYPIDVSTTQGLQTVITQPGNSFFFQFKADVFVKTTRACNQNNCIYHIQLSNNPRPGEE